MRKRKMLKMFEDVSVAKNIKIFIANSFLLPKQIMYTFSVIVNNFFFLIIYFNPTISVARKTEKGKIYHYI